MLSVHLLADLIDRSMHYTDRPRPKVRADRDSTRASRRYPPFSQFGMSRMSRVHARLALLLYHDQGNMRLQIG